MSLYTIYSDIIIYYKINMSLKAMGKLKYNDITIYRYSDLSII